MNADNPTVSLRKITVLVFSVLPSGSRNSVIFAIKNAQHVIPANHDVVQDEIFWQRNKVPVLFLHELKRLNSPIHAEPKQCNVPGSRNLRVGGEKVITRSSNHPKHRQGQRLNLLMFSRILVAAELMFQKKMFVASPDSAVSTQPIAHANQATRVVR